MGERENFEYAVEFVLRNEGGWTVDHAGPTNFGIVLRELQRTGEDLTGDGAVDVQDLRRMTREQAKDWYRRHRWLPGRYQLWARNTRATRAFRSVAAAASCLSTSSGLLNLTRSIRVLP